MPETESRTVRTWILDNRRQAIIAVLTIAIATLLFFVVGDATAGGKFTQGLATNVVVACAAYLLVNYIFYSEEITDARSLPARILRKIQEIVRDLGLRQVYESPLAVDWPGFLMGPPRARTIRGFARYLDLPVEQHHVAFVDFFRGGGRLSLVLPSEDDDDLLERFALQTDVGRGADAVRIRLRVRRTIEHLHAALEEADAKEREAGHDGCSDDCLNIVYTRRFLNYWALTADDQRAIVCPYEHWANVGRRLPVNMFDLSISPQLRDYVNHEVRRFVEVSKHDGDGPNAAEAGNSVDADGPRQ